VKKYYLKVKIVGEKSMKINIVSVGVLYIRYAIQSTQGWWTGEKWGDKKQAKLYYLKRDAEQDATAIQKKELEHKPIARYQATVDIEIYGDQPVDIEELKKYLALSAKLALTTPAPKKSVAYVSIDWDTLKEQSNQKDKI
jgi:hypothetical protein